MGLREAQNLKEHLLVVFPHSNSQSSTGRKAGKKSDERDAPGPFS